MALKGLDYYRADHRCSVGEAKAEVQHEQSWLCQGCGKFLEEADKKHKCFSCAFDDNYDDDYPYHYASMYDYDYSNNAVRLLSEVDDDVISDDLGDYDPYPETSDYGDWGGY